MRLQAAGLSAMAPRAAICHAHVAELGRDAAGAAQQAAVYDRRAAAAIAELQEQDQVVRQFWMAVDLAERRGIGVVLDADGNANDFPRQRQEVYVAPSEDRQVQHEAVAAHEAGHGDADGANTSTISPVGLALLEKRRDGRGCIFRARRRVKLDRPRLHRLQRHVDERKTHHAARRSRCPGRNCRPA